MAHSRAKGVRHLFLNSIWAEKVVKIPGKLLRTGGLTGLSPSSAQKSSSSSTGTLQALARSSSACLRSVLLGALGVLGRRASSAVSLSSGSLSRRRESHRKGISKCNRFFLELPHHHGALLRFHLSVWQIHLVACHDDGDLTRNLPKVGHPLCHILLAFTVADIEENNGTLCTYEVSIP